MTREGRAAERRAAVLAALASNGPGGALVDHLVDYSVPEGERDPVRLHRLRTATLRNDLYVLEGEGKVERVGSLDPRRAVRWRAAPPA